MEGTFEGKPPVGKIYREMSKLKPEDLKLAMGAGYILVVYVLMGSDEFNKVMQRLSTGDVDVLLAYQQVALENMELVPEDYDPDAEGWKPIQELINDHRAMISFSCGTMTFKEYLRT